MQCHYDWISISELLRRWQHSVLVFGTKTGGRNQEVAQRGRQRRRGRPPHCRRDRIQSANYGSTLRPLRHPKPSQSSRRCRCSAVLFGEPTFSINIRLDLVTFKTQVNSHCIHKLNMRQTVRATNPCLMLRSLLLVGCPR